MLSGWLEGCVETLIEKDLECPARQAPLLQYQSGRRIEDAYGESPPPPCLFGKRLCGQSLGPSLAKLSDYVFPQPLWSIFGERGTPGGG